MIHLLLSDLHLPPEPSPLRERFVAFLTGPAREAGHVWLLGDVFEAWIGDDVGLDLYAAECEALRNLVDDGVAVWLQRGNRDFLIGRDFCRATGVRLLDDPCVQRIGDEPVLLSHGDIWCTDDVGYQRWRRFARLRLAQWLFLRLPRSRRERIARRLRGHSGQHKQYQPSEIMDVNPAAVEAALRAAGVSTVIHGHTHRPDTHTLPVDGRACRRIVLPDWRPERMQYLRIDADGERLASA